ncbi:hypothetical protein [Halorussus sp. AFM4]|uniref:hypothetical protein n=1 Tax=Halorussus sp. AFM4 TaxID=3421651 RepID=UPI003EBBFE28
MNDEDASDRYRTGAADAAAEEGAAAAERAEDAPETDREAVEDRSDQHVPEEEEKLLARVPEWVVALGAGSLLAATVLTGIGSLFLWYSVSQGRFYGFAPYQVVMLAVQFTAVTAFQALAVRWARARIRWMWVMLAAIGGSLTFVALPFTSVALLCVGLGKYHFTFDTPMSIVRGDDG